MRTQACTILMAIGLVAPALAAEDWDALVKKYVEAFESVKEPVPTAYPWVARRLKTLFGVKSVGQIRVFSEIDGKRNLVADVYYKVGELHVINHDKGWNLVTKGKEAFEWETGATEGLLTKLNDNDLIDYLIYLTDPSCIMTCFYHDALYEPGKFLPQKEVERGMIEKRFKKPVEGFQAVFISEAPAWLCGVECGNPENGKTERQIYSKPTALKEVPAEVFHRLKGIKFKHSDLSVRRHIVYL
jgi:hypothetical protein